MQVRQPSITNLDRRSPIFNVPRIGRRTSKILYSSGVKTVEQFLALPDLLLEGTFGPSLPKVKRQARRLLSHSVQQSRRALVTRITQLISA